MLLLINLVLVPAIIAEIILKINDCDITITKTTLNKIKCGPGSTNELDLSDLNLRCIDDNVFDHLGNVEKLNLTGNKIDRLPEFVFQNLTNLRYLSLSINPYIKFDNIFVGLENLESLVLSGNGKKRFERGSLFGLSKLCNITLIDLSVNTISSDAFEKPSFPESQQNSQEVPAKKMKKSNRKLEGIEGSSFKDINDYLPWNNSLRVQMCIKSGSVENTDFISENTVLGDGCREVSVEREPRLLSLIKMDIVKFKKRWYRLGNMPVNTLDLSLNKIAQVTNDILNELPANIKWVDFSENEIKRLQRGMISNEHLIILEFHLNSIHTIEDGTFENTNIEILDLGNNKLTNTKFAKTLPTSLRSLYLQNNKIFEIGDNSFARLVQLVSLHLEFNNIRKFERNSFRGLASLQYLTLQSNRLSKLESGSFRYLKDLRSLELSKNMMIKVETGAFDGLVNLEELYIGHNQLRRISNDSLRGLSASLSILRLERNKITTLKVGTFVKVPVDELFLHGNRISRIKSGSFNLPTLKSLSLNNNFLQVINGDSFTGLPSLENIDFMSNRINMIEKGNAGNFGNLRYLELSNNSIKRLNNGALFGLGKSGNPCIVSMINNPLIAIQGGIFNNE